MKKQILLSLCCLVGISAFAQFTPGNIAVYRYGDGNSPIAVGSKTSVYIDEYNPTTGNKVQTISIPSTANGDNFGLLGQNTISSNNVVSFHPEGFPVLSRDGSTLSILGHNASGNGFVVSTINALGVVSSNTAIVDAIGAPRSAVVEGTSLYFNGHSEGVRYKEIGNSSPSERVSSQQNSPRVLTIAETYFNDTNNGIKLFAPIAGPNFPHSSLPTTQVQFTPDLPKMPSSAAIKKVHQIAAIKTANNRTIVYLIDDVDDAPVLIKLRSNGSGGDFVYFGRLNLPVNTKSIAAVYDKNTGVKLYLTSWGDGAETKSKLYTYIDNFTTNTEAIEPSGAGLTKILPGNLVELATAPENTTFRGVTMAPGTSILPVNLKDFTAKLVDEKVKLFWSTLSEKNSSHFNILKSYDGKSFQKIGEIKAAGDSDSNIEYSFVDENLLPGVNYYKLEQLDRDGVSIMYGPVYVNFKAEKTSLNIHTSISGSLNVFIYSSIKQKSKLQILDMSGKVIDEKQLNLEKGYSQFNIPVKSVKSGVQIAILSSSFETLSKKFMWQ